MFMFMQHIEAFKTLSPDDTQRYIAMSEQMGVRAVAFGRTAIEAISALRVECERISKQQGKELTEYVVGQRLT